MKFHYSGVTLRYSAITPFTYFATKPVLDHSKQQTESNERYSFCCPNGQFQASGRAAFGL